MYWELLLISLLDFGLLLAFVIGSRRANQEHHHRFDDVIEGVGILANELLSRTEDLLNIKEYMPQFHINNENPFKNLVEIFQMLTKSGNDHSGSSKNPRDSAGRYGQIEERQQEASETSEVDISP